MKLAKNLQVLEVLEVCMEKNINVYVAKQNMQLDGSMRTKEALAARKRDGVILGRPKGPAKRLKLDDKRDQIEKYLKMGLGIRPTAKLIDEPPSTLRDYIRRRKLKIRKER